MGAGGDRYSGHLLGGDPISVHVGIGDQGIVARHRRAVRRLELGMAGRRLHHHGLLAREPSAQAVRHADQHPIADPVHDGQGRLVEHREGGAAACSGADAVAGKDLQMLCHRFGVVHVRLGHAVAGDQPVDVVLGEPRIVQRSPGGVDAQARGAMFRDLAHLGVANTDDRDLAAQ